ncbi:RNA polymerase II transcription factor SIII subunit A-domain-containing protein [Boeremia exigua]|uniref:RNA polymerase II transcription factor SIII subunit A-domain-containing protein n=1 Tax=Boeremia exigua TaxID=749465 RepID=UPI001E8E6E19|nr:RNA polymerase II transcription factor SIII subunit A-domain-containing protein [Boeremia exigua]KAH6643516.1 RNA polymerase II transcription factor SIII subunit A-domain-containing protein [Boeremia exigua]
MYNKSALIPFQASSKVHVSPRRFRRSKVSRFSVSHKRSCAILCIAPSRRKLSRGSPCSHNTELADPPLGSPRQSSEPTHRLTMPVPSLYELARHRLIRNIDMLNDIGDIPFSFLEPVLRHIQNPKQLQELEETCPQIQGETKEIWKRYIRRDVPDWERKPHTPRDDKNWSKVYRKLMKDVEKEKLDQENQLKESMRALQAGRDVNKTVIMTTNKSYGRTGGHWSMGGRDFGRTAPPTKTGKVAMDKLKRGMFDRNQARTRAIQTPQHQLAMRKSMVSAIPERLVRMAQQETPKVMVLSKQASASAAEKRAPRPASSQQNIKHRPAAAASPPESATQSRPSLPPGRQFNAPKLKATAQGAGAAVAPKRKRESNLFQPSKYRRA